MEDKRYNSRTINRRLAAPGSSRFFLKHYQHMNTLRDLIFDIVAPPCPLCPLWFGFLVDESAA